MPTVNLGRVKGDKGDKGDAATIAVGTVTTLPAGSSATITNQGDENDAILQFGIPQGIQGEIGPIGPAIESLVINETSTARTLSTADENQYIRCTNASQTTVTIPPEAIQPWSDGAVIYFRRVGGAILIQPGTNVTISGEPSSSILANQNFAIKKVGTNIWDLI